MPQSRPKLRAKFPNGYEQANAVLVEHGWEGPSTDGKWKYKPTKPHIEVSNREWDAIEFLIYEWDFGGVDAPPGWWPSEKVK